VSPVSSDASSDQSTSRLRSHLERRLGQLLPNPRDHPAQTRVDWFEEMDFDDHV